MNIFGGGPLFSLLEMEGGQMDAPRPRMSPYVLASLPQPGVKGGGQVQAPCLENASSLPGRAETEGRNSQLREFSGLTLFLVNMVDGSRKFCLQHCLLSRTILCSSVTCFSRPAKSQPW